MQWILYVEEQAGYPVKCDGDKYRAMIRREGGEKALEEWMALEKAMKPLQTGASSFPAAAIRGDLGKPWCVVLPKLNVSITHLLHNIHLYYHILSWILYL